MLIKSSDINPFALSRRTGRPLILDGAMGSMLQQKGIKSSGSMWMSKANLDNPDIIYKIHSEYIIAGADIITTNTFRTNPLAVNTFDAKINVKRLVSESVKIALSASADKNVFVAGSNPPAEDCYQVERKTPLKTIRENHQKHIEYLWESGAHFIMNETQSHFDEIQIIAEFCAKNDIPFVMSIFTDENLKLLSGEKASEVINYLINFKPLAIGINCVMPSTFLKFYKKTKFNFNWGTYLNCGSGNFEDENISCGISAISYSQIVNELLAKKPSFVGSCCGSSPKHTKAIKKLLDDKFRN